MSSIVYAFVGGLLLGIVTVGYLYINGRIAGISGLLAQFISPSRDIFKKFCILVHSRTRDYTFHIWLFLSA